MLRTIDLRRPDLDEFSKEYAEHQSLASTVLKENNLDDASFVPDRLIREHTLTVIKAAAKFQALSSSRRLKKREEKRRKAIEMLEEAKMEGETPDTQLTVVSQAQKEMQKMVSTELAGLR
eukprot:SAG22_NODE_1805_length_3533_cov_1.343040_2_plen_120_part_00